MHAKPKTNFNLENIANFSTKDEYYPIPYDETIIDPVKMYQNPAIEPPLVFEVFQRNRGTAAVLCIYT